MHILFDLSFTESQQVALHVSALLHALVAISSRNPLTGCSNEIDDEEPVPVTSQLCQWKVPRK